MYVVLPLGIQTEHRETHLAHMLPTDDVVVQPVTFTMPGAVGILGAIDSERGAIWR